MQTSNSSVTASSDGTREKKKERIEIMQRSGSLTGLQRRRAKSAPVIGVSLRREGEGVGADGARRRGRVDEAPGVGERAGAAGAQEDDRRRRRRRRQSSVSGGRLHRWLDKLFAALLLRNGEDFVLGWCDLCIYIENASNFLAMLLSSFLLLIFEI